MPTRSTLGGLDIVVDVSSRDYYGYRNDLLELVPLMTSGWTDLSVHDPGVVVLELCSWVADNLSYYIDRCANEAFLFTCTQRASVIKHGKSVQYELSPNTSAQVTQEFVVSGAGTIAAGSQVGTAAIEGQEQRIFTLDADVVCGGAGTFTGVCYHGSPVEENLGDSDGTAGQVFELSQSPLAYNPGGLNSLTAWVEEAPNPWEQWIEVDNFTDSTAIAKHFVARIDENDTVNIVFGDGVNGKIPASGTENVKTTYRVGGGLEGNAVGPNTMTIMVATPSIVTATTNPLVPQGGADKETVDEAMVNIPQFVRQNDRNVTLDDYSFAASSVSGIASAKAVRGDNVAGSVYENYIFCRAAGHNPIPTGSWDPRTETSVGLLGLVGATVNAKRNGSVKLVLSGPYLVRFFFDLTVHVLSTFRQADVETKVARALSACFNGYELDSSGYLLGEATDIPATTQHESLPDGFPRNMGDALHVSYLLAMLEAIGGVDYATLVRLQRDPYARKLWSFVSNPTWSQIAVGEDTPRDTWTITFISSSQFTVEGAITGMQIAVGSIGVAYTTDSSEMGFTITAGTVPLYAGVQYEIVTGPYRGHLVAGGFELVTNYAGGWATHDVAYEGGLL